MLKFIPIKTFVLSFLLVQFSCSSSKSEHEDLYKEIIAVHDEVMPRMEEISSLSKKLKEKSSRSEKDKNPEVKNSIISLEKASLSMMDWMRKFNSSYDTLPDKEAKNYLKEEKLKIEKVREEINKAIEEAKKQI